MMTNPTQDVTTQEATEAANRLAQGYQQLIAKCWVDESFKQQLLNDPAGTLAQLGQTLPEGKTLKVVENTEDTAYLVIPRRSNHISDDDLESVAGGGTIGAAIGSGVGSFIGGAAGALGCVLAAPETMGGSLLAVGAATSAGAAAGGTGGGFAGDWIGDLF